MERPRVRTFVAVELPDPQRRRLAEYLRDCSARISGFRWTPEDNLHLTLRFLGGLEPPTFERLRQRLEAVRHPSFDLGLSRLGTFGSGRRARVLWLGVGEGGEALQTLAGAVDEACGVIGLSPPDHPFTAHLTLARARERGGSPLPSLDPPELPAWRVERFVLFESRLGRPASTYLPRARYRLGSSGGSGYTG
ncbi:MAG TPA: RNA 2',3'-cyclic phosphodiesterase [Candidatus Dormibacteraeota bacterium]|jgi:2'-5' RNA ligase|nr:RNA 2',3'-cyclic phosphodiesterase [Candidatus Dormibacteraeota bacterium]